MIASKCETRELLDVKMKRSTHALLDVSPKRQKVELDPNFDLFFLFQSFTCFLGIDSLLVYEASPMLMPVHRYAFLFSKLAQTCQLARKMFRPYSIVLKQVYFKFQLNVQYHQETYYDWRLFFKPCCCSYNHRDLTLPVFSLYQTWIHRFRVTVAWFPANY